MLGVSKIKVPTFHHPNYKWGGVKLYPIFFRLNLNFQRARTELSISLLKDERAQRKPDSLKDIYIVFI